MPIDDYLEDERSRIDAFSADARQSLARLSQEIDQELARLSGRIREAGGQIDAPRSGPSLSGSNLGNGFEYGIAGTIGELSRGELTGRSVSRSGLRLAGRALGLSLAGVLGGGGWRLSSLQSAAEQFSLLGRSRRDL